MDIPDDDTGQRTIARADNPHAPLSLAAFVGYLACFIAINALSTDIMLPGFPDIANSLRTDTTSVQSVITAYLFGFGLSQLFLGFVTDRYGRRPVLLGGTFVFTIASIACTFSTSLETMLLFRALQGLGAGGIRVIATAAARDCYEGRTLARVMSLVMTVFMAVPILAPAIGQGILLIADWRAIFGVLVLYGAVMLAASWYAFPETLEKQNRRPIDMAAISGSLAAIFGSAQTVGYTIAAGVFFGSLFGFIATAQQLMAGVYGLGVWFPLVFSLMALALSAASFINAMLVERYGMRLLSHGAVILFCLNSFAMMILQYLGLLHLWGFVTLHSVNMFLVGLVFANFNALALEPQGDIAGVASAFVGAVTVIIGAAAGFFIGQEFDGTAQPLIVGFFLSGFLCIIVLFVTEKGRLFQAKHAPKH
ncbi:MAG: multidrug effflux MFS transporter [Pseudomonadota bacterium]